MQVSSWLAITARICVVRDFKALHCQTATKIINCCYAQIYQITPHYVYLLLCAGLFDFLINFFLNISNPIINITLTAAIISNLVITKHKSAPLIVEMQSPGFSVSYFILTIVLIIPKIRIGMETINIEIIM